MKILIIDQYGSNMESLFDLINKNFHFTLVGCNSESEGVDYIKRAIKNENKIDVLFIDEKEENLLSSPALVLANLYKKTVNPKMSIVFFTMLQKSPLIQDAIDVGYFNYYLSKTISKEDLMLFISNIRFIKHPFD